VIRGEIWWADLPPARGSEPAKHRPVTVDKSFFIQHVSMLPGNMIGKINAGLKQILDIP
jgi:hypothetical protein